jgi:hypothetical protein
MMSGVPLETCWAFNKRWNNIFYYKVASCWLFLLIHTTIHGSMNIKSVDRWSILSSRVEARIRKFSRRLRSLPSYLEHTSEYKYKRMQWSVWKVREAKRMGGVLLNNAVSSNDSTAPGLTNRTWVGSMARIILTGKNLSQVHPVHHRYHKDYITWHKIAQRVLIAEKCSAQYRHFDMSRQCNAVI